MERENSPQNKARWRLLRSFSPFLLLLIGAIAANYLIEDLQSAQMDTSHSMGVTATPDQSLTVQGAATRAPIATAIPFMSPTPMEPQLPAFKAVPTRTSDKVALLLGPPAQSNFSLESGVTFYWQAAEALDEGQAFALYLVSVDNERRLTSIAEPNLGQFFQSSPRFEEFDLPSGIYAWEVRLEDTESGAVIGRSESREIRLLPPAD